jgi:hypothetical protein
MPRIVSDTKLVIKTMTLALVTACHDNSFGRKTMTEQNESEVSTDPSEASSTLRRVIDRSPTRHKINLLLVLWPPILGMLECVTRRVCEQGPEGQEEELVSRALMAGLRAADAVGEYTAPAWPMRVVDAFAAGFQDYAKQRVSLACDSGTSFCGPLPACRTFRQYEGEGEGQVTISEPIRKSVRGGR